MRPELISISAIIGKDGHILDDKKGESINIREGAKFKIILLEDDLIIEDLLQEPLTTIQQAKDLKAKNNVDKFKMVLKRGASLYFRMFREIIEEGASKKKAVIYEVELLEDLFVYKREKSTQRPYALFDCQCKLLHEGKELKGKSLNQIYSLTYKKLYNIEKSAAAQATVRFFMNKKIVNINTKKPAPKNCIKWFLENFEKLPEVPV